VKDSIIEKMRGSQSQLAFFMDDNAENLAFFDHKGRLVAEEMYTILVSMLLFRPARGKKWWCPSPFPRWWTNWRAATGEKYSAPKPPCPVLMEESAPPQFFLSFDAITSLAQILAFCAKERKTLGDVVDSIPAFYLQKKKTPCAWKDKGRVMRRLIEDTHGGKWNSWTASKSTTPKGGPWCCRPGKTLLPGLQ
jgi:mannose-1-phosphate guanylyltransferase / phosphomannomutase